MDAELIQQNLLEMKKAMEKILGATSHTSVAKLIEASHPDLHKVAEIAQLHSYAADAYAHLLGVIAKQAHKA